jgi:hypothetical protein
MRRRGFLAGLLATPILPHLPVPAEELLLSSSEPPVIKSGDSVVVTFDATVNSLTGRVVYDSQAAGFRVLVNNVGDGRGAGPGAVKQVYRFPDRPVYPVKTAKFCRGG